MENETVDPGSRVEVRYERMADSVLRRIGDYESVSRFETQVWEGEDEIRPPPGHLHLLQMAPKVEGGDTEP